MCSDDDTLDLLLSQDVTDSNHCYGHAHHSSVEPCDMPMSVCYGAEDMEQSLEQLPPTKLLDDQQVLDQAPIGQALGTEQSQ